MLLVACTSPSPDSSTDPDANAGRSVPSDEDTPAAIDPSAPDAPVAHAQGLPPADAPLPALRLTEIARIDAPIDTATLPDGTVLVAQRGGVVRVLIDPDGTPTGAAGRVVVDVSERTTTDGERGLLAIAVAPDGRELFLSLTDAAGDTLIEAHPLSGSRAIGPPRTVYTLPQPRANHNGGAILFAPDGMLLVGLGDGGGSGDPLGAGQDLSTPLGAVLRLDVGESITRTPTDNPFTGDPAAAAEIVAFGLRNPWRISLDTPRGELWIADVGQSAREEINRIHLDALPGANFGWALREGSLSFLGEEPEGHVPPIHDYAHGPGCSVTGGHVYRGAALPELVGAYVFSDWCDGELRALLDDGGTTIARGLGVAGERVVGFGRDAGGELLVLDLSGRVLLLGRA